jgi:hypothetical protein
MFIGFVRFCYRKPLVDRGNRMLPVKIFPTKPKYRKSPCLMGKSTNYIAMFKFAYSVSHFQRVPSRSAQIFPQPALESNNSSTT